MNRRKGKSTSSGVIETFVGDALVSFCYHSVGPLYDNIKPQHGLGAWLLISTTLYSIIGLPFGQYSSNPATMLSSYATGKGDNTLLFLIARSIPQAIGWWAGNETVKDYTAAPDAGDRKGSFPLDKLAVTEVVISFANCFIGLYLESIEAGPYGNILKDWLFTLMIMISSELFNFEEKKLALNPADKFGEELSKGRISGEHFFIYWLCPLTGAIIAGWTFRIYVMIERILRVILSAIIWLTM